jgi:hypothetical protein
MHSPAPACHGRPGVVAHVADDRGHVHRGVRRRRPGSRQVEAHVVHAGT